MSLLDIRPADINTGTEGEDTDHGFCDFCGGFFELVELTPGPSGDPCCDDCHADHADVALAYAY